jgi:hypothetical protein
MATVLMRKGDRSANIFDSPETIAQARKDGYSFPEPDAITGDTIAGERGEQSASYPEPGAQADGECIPDNTESPGLRGDAVSHRGRPRKEQ